MLFLIEGADAFIYTTDDQAITFQAILCDYASLEKICQKKRL